jgi:hypothetical protein
MRASRSDRHRAGACIARALLAAASIVLVPVAVLGQQPGQPLGPPIPLIPPPSQPLAATPEPSPPISARESAVASEPLAAPSLGWTAGVAPPRDALPGAFWHGTTRGMADLLLARMPDTLSPALQSLMRRLLLSSAAAPEGPDKGDRTLPGLRAAALLRLGELDAARAAIAAIPERDRGPALPLAVAADAISGNIGRACTTVREAVRRDQGAFWQSALIACQALQGETEQASLGLQLLAEEQAPRDEVLGAAVEALAGRPSATAIGRAESLDPLTLRLLVKARQPLTPALVESLRPDLALCLARDEEAPAGTRLAAAERAARFGALHPDRLRALYTDNTGGGEPSDESVLDHSRRFAAIERTVTATERLHQIGSFADAFGASQPGSFTLGAQLVLPALRQIEPDPGLTGSAPLVSRLLLAAGDIRAARRWSALVSGTEAPALRFLLALVIGNEEQVETPPVPVLVALSAALGRPIPPADWVRLPEASWADTGAPSPPSAAWLDLAEAAQAKRIGETVLAAVIVAAPTGTLSTDPIALFTAVSALKRVGLDADARRLAIEAALAAGL